METIREYLFGSTPLQIEALYYTTGSAVIDLLLEEQNYVAKKQGDDDW